MKIPYYKNGYLSHPLEVNAKYWEGCQSKNKRVMERNERHLWRIVREVHPDARIINLSFRDFHVESDD